MYGPGKGISKEGKMKKIGVIFVLFLVAIFLINNISFAEENVGFIKRTWRKLLNTSRGTSEKEAAEPKRPSPRLIPQPVFEESPLFEMTEEEIRERIKSMLQKMPEIENVIPELRVTRDKNGNIIKIEYILGGVFVNTETLDKDVLIEIYHRTKNEQIRIQAEQFQKQIKALKAIQNIPKIPNIPKSPDAYKPSEVPKPPKVPKLPSMPYKSGK